MFSLKQCCSSVEDIQVQTSNTVQVTDQLSVAIAMSKQLEWIIHVLSAVLFANACLVLYSSITSNSGRIHKSNLLKDQVTEITKNKMQSHHNCCNCNFSHQWKKEVVYQKIADEMPHLDPVYYATTRTRLGSDVKFDLQTCPSNSVMLKNNSNFTPLHLDCPTLFIVGARKAGTSSLYQYVTKHPDFEGTRLDWGPKVGETFYFSSHYKSNWSRYINLFPSDGVMTGEASVGNLVECNVPKRLFETCGKQAKIVMMFRDPVKRFVSNFLMRAKLGSARVQNTTAITTFIKLHLDNFFHLALAKNLDVTRMSESWTKLRCLFRPATNTVYEGLYYVHLLNWLCNFSPENILIINSEEFYQKPSMILSQVFQFLGLKELDSDTLKWITSNVYNKGSYNIPSYQKMSTDDRKKLLGVYTPFNKALFKALNWNDVEWSK